MNLFITALLSFILFASCTTTPTKKQEPKPAPLSAQELYKQSVQSFKARKYNTTIKLSKDIIYKYSDYDIAGKVYLMLGKSYSKLGQKKEALASYTELINSPYYSDEVWTAHYNSAYLNWSFKNEAQTIFHLNSVINNSRAPKELLVKSYKILMEVYQYNERYLDVVYVLVKLHDISNDIDEKDAYKVHAQELAESKLSRDDLSQVAATSKFGFLRTSALYRLGLMNFESGQYSRAENYFEDVIDLEPDTALAEKSQSFLQQINARSKVNSDTIGVILPLSGRLAPLGYRTLAGIEYGLGIFNKNNNTSLKLAVIDSEANPNVAKRAVEKLVIEDNVIAILGSIKGKTSLALAQKAQELGVPTIGFALNSELTRTGDFVFRNALTSRMQVKKLVTTAINKYGAKRFAILYPNDNYGVEFANMFWDEVLQQGGKITGAQDYTSEEKDFRDPIRRLVGTFYREDRFDEYKLRMQEWESKYANTRKKPPKDLLPPIVDFDALFIPDSDKALGQIAPMLEYNDVKNVLLLGTSLWNSPTFIRRADKYADSTLFVDSFYNTDNKQYKELSELFQSEFNRKPDSFEIQAYETASILRFLIQNRGIDSRSELQKALSSLKNFPGLSGSLEVNEFGDIERPLSALKVEKGKILKITE